MIRHIRHIRRIGHIRQIKWSYVRFRLQRQLVHLQLGRKTRRFAGIFLLLVIFQALLFLIFRPQTVDAAWYNTGWQYRKKLTVNEGQVSGSSNLTNFPVWVSLTDTDVKLRAQSDGDDIMFTSSDGTTKLDHELVSYTSSTGAISAWVEVPTLDYNDDTTIYMYYGNQSAAAQESVAATWNANHVGVWHLDEAPANTVTGHLNSATNTNDGTPQNFSGSAGTTTNATGKIDGADYFDGNDDRVDITDAASLSFNPANNYTWSAWVNRDTMGADWEAVMTQTQGADTYIEWYTGDLTGDATWGVVTDGVVFGIQSSAGNYEIAHSNNNVLTTGSWYHVAVTFTAASSAGSKIKIYVNGSDVTATGDTANAGTLGSIDPNNHRISENAAYPGENTDGLLDEVRMATTNESTDWITTEYNNQNSPSTFFRVGAQAEIPDNARPSLHWGFDEGNGTTANDTTGSSNTGTISGATWQNEEMCQAGKCLKFDGSNDYVRKTYSSDTDLDPGNGSFSVGAWFRHPASISGTDIIVSRADGINGVGYKLYYDATNGVCFGIDGSAGSFPSDSACTTTSHADNKWHYITGVKSGTSSITLYIDGKQVAQDSSLSATASISGSSSAFYVGLDVDASSNPWDGFLDEVKYFDTARTAAQIQTDFAAKGGVLGASTSFGDGFTSTLSNGLVGYWKMDETSWASTCASTPVVDSSGNARNGNACPNASAATVAAGKFGNAGSFDGTNDYVDLGNASQLYTPTNNQWSLSAWIKPTDFAEHDTIIRKDGGGGSYFIRCQSSDGAFQSLLAYGASYSQQSGGTCTAGVWQLVTMTYDGKVRKHFINGVLVATFTENITLSFETGSSVVFGASTTGDTSENFKGLIDEARIYNRYLTDTEVAALYDWAPGPVGHWKLDEGSGQTLADSSGNNNGGTLGANSSSSSDDPAWGGGKYGNGLLFDGTNDSFQVPDNDVLDIPNSFTIETWIYPMGTIPGSGSFVTLISKEASLGSAGNYYLELTDDDDINCGFWNGSAYKDHPSSGAGVQLNVWQHLACSFDDTGNTITIYLNGKQILSASEATSPFTNSEQVWINGLKFGGQFYRSKMDDVRIYNYTRSTKQIISDMNAGHPAIGTPVSSAVGHWSLDEGYGTSANDQSPNSNTLTLSAASWTNSGKFGKAWNGTGSVWLTRSDDDDFDFAASDDMSLSLWFKSDNASNPANNEYLLEKGTITNTGSAGYALYANSSGNIVYGIKDDAAWGASSPNTVTPDDTATSTTDIYDNAWHHLVATKTGTSRIDLYVDGKLNASDTSLAATATLANAIAFRVGDDDADSANAFNGDLDEIKIFRAALSADDVKAEYNQGKSQVMGALSTASDGITVSNDAARAYCVPGDTTSCSAPVGEWKFDEGTSTTVYDTSGSANNGTLTNGPGWASGKIGTAVDFDGSNDYINVGDPGDGSLDFGSGSFTYMLWVYVSASAATWDQPIWKGGDSAGTTGYTMTLGTGQWDASVSDGGGAGSDIATAVFGTESNFLNRWTHLAVVVDRNDNLLKGYVNGRLVDNTGSLASVGSVSNANALQFSHNSASNFWKGKIDDIRIYNYARTPAQVAWDYNRGGPVGYWQFDDCTGTTAYDASGNGYNATISIPGSGTQTGTGSCSDGNSANAWNNGTTGKYNSAMSFDKTDDKVTATGNTTLALTGDVTLSAWVKQNSVSGSLDHPIISYDALGETQATNILYRMRLDASTNTVTMSWENGAGTNTDVTSTKTITPTTGTWHHLVAVRDATNKTVTFYLNGNKLEAAQSYSTNPDGGTSANVGIGYSDTSPSYFDGLIDDAQIYNYILTATQIRMLYNQGSAVRFGPSTGSP